MTAYLCGMLHVVVVVVVNVGQILCQVSVISLGVDYASDVRWLPTAAAAVAVAAGGAVVGGDA